MTRHERDALVGMSEIRDYLGISEGKVRELSRQDGAFPAIKRGGIWISSRRAMDEWSYETSRRQRK